MKSLVILLSGILSFFCVDLQLFRRGSRDIYFGESISIEISDQREKRKRKTRKYKNKKYKKTKKYSQKQYKFQGTKAKDLRYSNQRLLRRMYRND